MFKNLLKSILPIILIKFINNILGRSIKITGEYSSWNQALNYSTGYNDNIIFHNMDILIRYIFNKNINLLPRFNNKYNNHNKH